MRHTGRVKMLRIYLLWVTSTNFMDAGVVSEPQKLNDLAQNLFGVCRKSYIRKIEVTKLHS